MPKPSSAPQAAYHHGDLRRVLIATALDLVTEEQNWTFSLREVARRAEVSHNAHHNHFADKRELLAAVAVAGFERLHDGLRGATADIDDAEAALRASGEAYVRLGLANPALYRLMFGPDLADSPPVRAAGARARAVLGEVIVRGARAGAFAVAPDDPHDVALAALSAWSAVHGLTMLVIDRVAAPDVAVEEMIGRVQRMVVASLRRVAA